MIVRTPQGDRLDIGAQGTGGHLTVLLVISNPTTYTGSGGTADIALTREQATALALHLVATLGETP